jgi:hypothetical protein
LGLRGGSVSCAAAHTLLHNSQAQKDLMQRIRDVMHEKGGSHAGIAGYE